MTPAEITAAQPARTSRFNDLTGQTFGAWTVLELAPSIRRRERRWKVRCECGATRTLSADVLLKGESRSCGCQRQALCAAAYALTALEGVPGDEETCAPIRPEHVTLDALDRAFRVLHAENPSSDALYSCCTPLDLAKLPDLARLFYHLATFRMSRNLVSTRYHWYHAEAVAQLDAAIHLHAAGKLAPLARGKSEGCTREARP